MTPQLPQSLLLAGINCLMKQKFAGCGKIFLSVSILFGLVISGLVISRREARRRISQSGGFSGNEAILSQVSRIAVIPDTDQPVIYTIDDITKFNRRQFFRNARNGDKVLIFPQSRKAIIYRPATGQIVEMGPVNIAGSIAPD